MCDVPFGVLLSGGLDSSLIASISSRILSNRPSSNWGNKLHSFSIGLKGAPDLENAQVVADFPELFIMSITLKFKKVLIV